MSAAGAAQPSKLPTASTSARPATASSAPSSSSTPAQHFQAPAQVIYDLSVARDPSTASESSWQDATESSLEWLLSLTPAPRPSSPKGKEKADTQDVVHWFCGRRGAKECYESAVFCLRLLAFKRTGLVDNWRGQFDRLMLSCPDCVEAFQHAKAKFRERYLMILKPERAVQTFIDGVERTEAAAVISALTSAGLQPPPEDDPMAITPSSVKLSVVQLAVIHNCLVNSLLFQRDDVVSLLASGLPIASALQLPAVVTPGLLALRMHEYRPLREWAQLQLDTCQSVSPAAYTSNALGAVIESHLGVLASRDRRDESQPTAIHLRYTKDRRAFWDGLAGCLNVLSADTIRAHLLRKRSTAGKDASTPDVVHLVASHLGDREVAHLPLVLACWRWLLDRLGPHVWAAGEERFEEVVLHAVLDNPTFEAIFVRDEEDAANLGAVSEEEILGWLPPFLASVAHSPHLFTNSLAIITSTFLDRLQQLRFPVVVRARAITLAFSILTDVFLHGDEPAASTTSAGGDIEIGTARFPHADAAMKVLDMHGSFIARLAFDPRYNAADGEWAETSELARTFVCRIMERDSKRIQKAIYTLGRYSERVLYRKERLEKQAREKEKAKKEGRKAVEHVVPDEPKMPAVIAFSSMIWDRSFACLEATDLRGIAIVLRGASPTCHFEKLSGSVFAIRDLIRPQMKALNKALELTRDKLTPLLMGLVDERPEVLDSFLRSDGISEHITLLLCSPIEEIHNAAQGIVKQTFDVTTRREVFRSLLWQDPDRTIQGLFTGLKGFEIGSTTLPETSGMAKRLVRCLSDIIDVLCATSDGLLRDSTFTARAMNDVFRRRLAKVWSQMCKVMALLFRQTPKWANFLQPDDMTDWMREALLFGTDLVKEFDTLTMAVAGSLSGQILAEGSQLGVLDVNVISLQLIADLNAPLEDLLGWLRLNDLDLLDSTVDLIRAMLGLFGRSTAELQPKIVDRILQVIERASRKDTTRSYILREDQLGELRGAVQLAMGDAPASAEVNQDSQKQWWAKLSARSGTSTSSTSKTQSSKSAASKGVLSSATNGKAPKPPTLASKASAAKKGPNFGVPAMRNAARPKGVPWTTYSSKKADELSDESSSDDDEKPDTKLGGLAQLAQAQKPTIKAVERRTVKMLEDKAAASKRGKIVGVKAQAEADRAAGIARLRGTPDLSPLHRQILQWDSDHPSEYPPSMKEPLKPVGTAFKNPDDYFAAFEPLLLTECWEQIRTAKTESAKEGQIVICTLAGRQAVNDFVDVFATISHSDMPDRMWFGESDLVLVRQGSRQLLAKIQQSGRKREFLEVTLRCHLGTDKTEAGPGLVARTKWEILKLYNLSTIHREYAALQSVIYLDLFDDIISPRPAPVIPTDSRAIAKTVAAYQVNQPQAEAIHGALKTSGFSLIQGPPGTGKTKTILGLVGAFIDSRPRAAAPIVPGKPTDPLAVEPVAKLLLCAPSNAAVDEVAKRLKDGIRNADGQHFVPNIVRIGADSSVDIAVKDIFIDEIVERALSGAAAATAGGDDSQAKMVKMRAEVDSLRAVRDAKNLEIQAVEINSTLRGELFAELKQIKSQIFELSQKLDTEKDKAQRTKRAMDAQQRKMRLKVLSDADIICATLSGAGHDYMAQLPFDFETVIIDEAAQSVELSSLIPLKYGCKRCILVGDPLQLPPTVISGAAKRAGYDRSLFVRMMERGRGSHLLSIQYRMHPNISAFPSAAFYDSRLTDGPDMDKKTVQPWHTTSLFPPYAFFHVRNGKEVAGRHHSWSNPAEAQVALAIYERLLRDYPKTDFDYRIGIVTPYKGQVSELKSTFRRKYGADILSRISFNTVDGFQGQEKDIIILSCVRGGSVDKGVGFLADTRRMNVALTRARSSLFVLGDSNKLRQNKYWSNLVDDAQTRGLLSHVDPGSFRSLAAAAPLTVRAALPPSKSGAKAIEIATSSIAPVRTPQAISAQSGVNKSAKAATGSPSSRAKSAGVVSVKRRVADSMNLPSDQPQKKVKTEDGEEEKPRPPTLKAPKPAPPPARPKPKPSLFMPTKKRPAPTSAGGPAKRPPS